MMGVQGAMDMSLGEWVAIVRHWKRAHDDKPEPPTIEEFEAAVEKGREIR